jgi:hypothetical protein
MNTPLSALLLALTLPVSAAQMEGPGGKTPVPTPITPVNTGLGASAPTPLELPGPRDLSAAAPVNLPESALPQAAAQTPDAVREALKKALPPELASRLEQPPLIFKPLTPSRQKAADAARQDARKTPAEAPRGRAAESILRISEAVHKAAQAGGDPNASAEAGSSSGREIQAALTGEKESRPDDYVSVYLQGVADGSIPTGPQLVPAKYEGEYHLPARAGVPYFREQTVNPGEVYAEAYFAASLAARKRGLPERVFFAEVMGSAPLNQNGHHLSFTFYAAGPRDSKADRKIIYVDFWRGMATINRFDVKTSMYSMPASFPFKMIRPELDSYVPKGFRSSPESAFASARRAVPELGVAAGFTAAFEDDGEGIDLWYRFHDDKGNVVAVNANDGRVRKIAAPAPAAPAKDRGLLAPLVVMIGAVASMLAALVLLLTSGNSWSAGIAAILGAGLFVLANVLARLSPAPVKPAPAPNPLAATADEARIAEAKKTFEALPEAEEYEHNKALLDRVVELARESVEDAALQETVSDGLARELAKDYTIAYKTELHLRAIERVGAITLEAPRFMLASAVLADALKNPNAVYAGRAAAVVADLAASRVKTEPKLVEAALDGMKKLLPIGGLGVSRPLERLQRLADARNLLVELGKAERSRERRLLLNALVQMSTDPSLEVKDLIVGGLIDAFSIPDREFRRYQLAPAAARAASGLKPGSALQKMLVAAALHDAFRTGDQAYAATVVFEMSLAIKDLAAQDAAVKADLIAELKRLEPIAGDPAARLLGDLDAR